MRALDKKLLRDLWHLRSQVAAIGLVMASGIAVLIMSLSTLEALRQTSDAYYERYRFADVFAMVKRAPLHLEDRIAAIEGVRLAETRIVQFATLDMPSFAEPVTGQFVSVPRRGQSLLNQLVLRRGAFIEPQGRNQVLLNEAFAEAHGLNPGDQITAVLNGHRRTLQVAGIVLSPEFIYALGPGSLMPDDKRFGVLWMARDELAAAFDLKGAFNSVALELSGEVSPQTVIPPLDKILERFGGVGAIARADQLSNWFVMNELDQLATMSRMLPTIFLLVAAFLTNMVLARLIATERSQIGLMKAFGYSNLEVGWHYTKIVLGVCAVGIIIGAALGGWFGRINTQVYAELFGFPLLLYRPSPEAFFIASGLCVGAALAGAFGAVRRAVALPPAEAMMPPAPPAFKASYLSDTALARWLDQPTRIVMRNIARCPVRAGFTVIGIAFSVGLLVLALQWNDALDYLARSYFFDAQRQHVMLGFKSAQADSILNEVKHLPGVLAVEGMRAASVDFSNGARRHRGAVTGVAGNARLQPIYDDRRGVTIAPPLDGLVVSSMLAEKLGAGIGSEVWIEVLEGRRPQARIPVVEIIETHLGMPAYMHIDALNRLLKERPSVEYVNLLVDRRQESILYAELKKRPAVSAVMLRQSAIDSFHETVTEHLMVFLTMFSALAFALGFGVAYNSTRIALSERGRELATLRVLGFTRGEISYILLGEVALLIVVALPVGCLVGRGLAGMMAASFKTELFRIPLHIEPSTYGASALVALAAAAFSAAIVRRRVDRLNLISVLKTRE